MESQGILDSPNYTDLALHLITTATYLLTLPHNHRIYSWPTEFGDSFIEGEQEMKGRGQGSL